MNRMLVKQEAQKMADKFTHDELWDRYKSAKLMDDKEEVRIFRKALDIKGPREGRSIAIG